MVTNNSNEKCPFGQGDNLPIKQAVITARIERQFPINIPANHRVCSIGAETSRQVIEYDDHIYLGINQYLIMGGQKHFYDFPVDSSGFPVYQWLTLRGKSASGIGTGGSYCANGISCQLPPSEMRGDFYFSIPQERSRDLFSAIGDNPLYFNLIITGDNDPSLDCQLEDNILLKINYTYVLEE